MQPIKVLVVDDSVLFRRMFSEIISRFPRFECIGTAPSGLIALKKLELNPASIVFLDVHMPEMDGLETLRRIKTQFPGTLVIMISSFDNQNADITVKALQHGAIDFIKKPESDSAQESRDLLEKSITPVLRIVETRLAWVPHQSTSIPEHKDLSAAKIPVPNVKRQGSVVERFSILVVGVSTGGPEALARFIPKLPFDFPIPILVVQHMPADFTKSLAENLQKKSSLRVNEASDGDLIKKGSVYIAPGGRHMEVRKVENNFVLGLSDSPPENSCRPSVDVLFRSVAALYGEKGVLATVLTGMGNDGLSGVRALKHKKCYCITQSAESCVVYGMPRAIDEGGLNDESVPIDELASAVLRKVKTLPITTC